MTNTVQWIKRFAFGLVAFTLVACAETGPVDKKPEPLGDFKLGYSIVVAKNAEKGPFSRDATAEELEASLKAEVERVFGVYDGPRLYHIAIAVDAYVLAVPGVPIVASPKSAFVVSLNVWDDARQVKVTEEHKQFTVLEAFTAKSIFGSGLTQSREEQMAGLSRSTVKQIHIWLRENEAVFQSQPTETPDT